MSSWLAIDLGGGSGRAVAGYLEGERIALTELCRFDNYYVSVGGQDYWDVFYLFRQILVALEKMEKEFPGFRSIGIDTWGNDFALLDLGGQLIGHPRCTRNSEGRGMRRFFQEVMSAEEYFMECGAQIRAGNALFQLYERILEGDPALTAAACFLMLPDLFGYLLTGKRFSEYTAATTGQFIDLDTRRWNRRLIGKLNLPAALFGELVMPGTKRFPLLAGSFPGQRKEVRYVPVASHDTASAVFALALSEDEAFLSSGTWSIVGTEVPEPIVNKEAFGWNFSNEGTGSGGWRLQKDVMGMWTLQRLYEIWNREQGPVTWEEIVREAGKAEAFRSLVNLEAEEFVGDADPRGLIRKACEQSGEPVPEGIGQTARCIYESMALRYRYTIRQLERLVGKTFSRLWIVGGGGKNRLLNQMTADAAGLEVVAGLYEGASMGSILLQAAADGKISGRDQFRALSRASFRQERFLPEGNRGWDEAAFRYERLCREKVSRQKSQES